jgi:endonuclease YncB( thermonuclease family)
MYIADEDSIPFASQWRDATVERVVDGDTFDFENVDLGFGIKFDERFRLLHIAGLENRKLAVDAWEVRGEERPLGLEAAEYVEKLFERCDFQVRIATRKDPKIAKGKYGRYLACVLLDAQLAFPLDNREGWVSLGDLLIHEGHAEEKKYR